MTTTEPIPLANSSRWVSRMASSAVSSTQRDYGYQAGGGDAHAPLWCAHASIRNVWTGLNHAQPAPRGAGAVVGPLGGIAAAASPPQRSGSTHLSDVRGSRP